MGGKAGGIREDKVHLACRTLWNNPNWKGEACPKEKIRQICLKRRWRPALIFLAT